MHLPYTNINRSGLVDERSIAYPVLMSLNTDNPGNFSTTIANEYRLLGQGLQKRGLPKRDILAWLESVRQTGISSIFIPDWSPPTKEEFQYMFENLFTLDD